MTQIVVLASGNVGKLKEFQHMLTSCDLDVRPQSEFKVAEAEEIGLSFVENAIIKARNACDHTGLPAIADDSGLAVDALKGAPGIYSARFSQGWQGQEASDQHNNNYLLEQLADISDAERTARYHCILVYMRSAADPTPLICQGSLEGRILRQPAGDNGFGYDPLFYLPKYQCSCAQLDKAEKNRISHRAIAMQKLLQALTH